MPTAEAQDRNILTRFPKWTLRQTFTSVPLCCVDLFGQMQRDARQCTSLQKAATIELLRHGQNLFRRICGARLSKTN
jgi:hypothetical protein